MTRSLRAPDRAEEEPDGAPDAAETPGPEVPEGLDRLRVVLAAAMGTVLVSYAMLVPAALLVVLAGGGADSSVDGAFAAAIPLWLAAHLIPLALEGQPLSVLPLLPTVAVIVVVAWGARWAARRLGRRIRQDAGAVVAASAGAHAAVAVLGSALLPTSAAVGAAPWAAMLGAGLIAAVGAGIGVLRACGLPADWRERLQGWPAAGLAAAAVGGAALLLAGALVVLVGLVVGAGRVHGLYEALAPTGGAALGMTLLGLAYLPNAAIAGASWLLGPGVDVGLGAWTPFGGAPAPLPPLPLLGALPTVPSPAWAVVVVIVPVGIGLVVGGICRTVLGPESTLPERMRAVGVASITLALVAALVATLAGGRLAAGRYDPVAMPAWLVLLAVVVWIGGPAAVLALVQRGGPGREAARDDEELGWYRDGYEAEEEISAREDGSGEADLDDGARVGDGDDRDRADGSDDPEGGTDGSERAEGSVDSDDSGDSGRGEASQDEAADRGGEGTEGGNGAEGAEWAAGAKQRADGAAGDGSSVDDPAEDGATDREDAPRSRASGSSRSHDGRARAGGGRAVERARARRQERSNGTRSRPVRFRPGAAPPPALRAVEDLPHDADRETVENPAEIVEERLASPDPAERTETDEQSERVKREDRADRLEPTEASAGRTAATQSTEPEPRPRTVGELVALRARQAEERAAREAAERDSDAP
ncbi:cell division protein PerM [Pseudonocardia halophobica]|uniref:cell division protein PerM n=1 Tax=Pseudonocardia halophobica TaxID=29401 RepID=UPI003D8B28BF